MRYQIPLAIFMSIIALVIGGAGGYLLGEFHGYSKAEKHSKELLGQGKYQFAGPAKGGGDKKGDGDSEGKEKQADKDGKSGSKGDNKVTSTVRLALLLERLNARTNPARLVLEEKERALLLKALDGLENIDKLEEQDAKQRLDMIQDVMAGGEVVGGSKAPTTDYQAQANPFQQTGMREIINTLRRLAKEQKDQSSKGE
ncbi:MAG: hypothetical protein HY040_09855 [Planctomycetes bacterium]|nr:hypothetical protein [Planctomycetota bacterium]